MKHELKRKHAVILTLLLDVCLSGWVDFLSESSDDVVTHADVSTAFTQAVSCHKHTAVLWFRVQEKLGF